MMEKYLKKLFSNLSEIITIKGEHKFTAIEIINKCNKQGIGIKPFLVADSKNGKLFYEIFRNYKMFQNAVEKCTKTKKQIILNDGSYCITPLICKDEVPGIITVCFEGSRIIFGKKEKQLLIELSKNAVCGALSLQNRTKQLNAKEFKLEYNNILFKTLWSVSESFEKYDNYRAGHQHRVALLARAIAKKMRLNTKYVDEIFWGASIHDIGKLFIPSGILNRPGKLIFGEYEIIKKHPEFGLKIVKDIKFNSKIPRNIIIQHHERIDGSGYPSGIKGDAIPIESRIVTVADVVEAMTSLRSYHKAFSIKYALNELEINKGTLFDPQVVDVCVELFTRGKFKFDK